MGSRGIGCTRKVATLRLRIGVVAGAAAGGLLLGGAATALADGIPNGPYMQAVLGDGAVGFFPLAEGGRVMVNDRDAAHSGIFWSIGLRFGVSGPLSTAANGPNFGVAASGTTVGTVANAGWLPGGNSPRTVEAWFRSTPGTNPNANYPLVAWGEAGTGRPYGLVVQRHGAFVDHYGGVTAFTTTANVFDGRWHDLAATYDGSQITMYLDGAPMGAPQQVQKGLLNTAVPSTLIIGDWVDHFINSPLSGEEADVAVYANALYASQIRAHYEAAGGTVGGGGVSSIASSLPSPSDVFGNAGIVLASAAVAIAGTLFITFPAQLFNLTLQENYSTIAGWIAPLRRRLAALGGALHRATAPRRDTATAPASVAAGVAAEWPVFALVVGAGALLGGFLDPGFGFNAASLESYVAIVLSMLAGITVAAFVSEVYHRRRGGPVRRHLRALPLGLLLGAICVVISRVSGFQPGYLYGVVCGVAFDRVLTARESGHVAALSTLSVICVSVLAWVLWVPLSARAAAQGAFPLLVVLDDFLAALLVGGLVGSVIGLLPLRFLPGGTVKEWNPRVWFALFAVAVFALVEFVIRSPASSGGHHSGLVVTIVLFAVFAGVSVGFREYFAARWRREHGVATHGFGALLHELVSPRPEPAMAVSGVAVSGGGAASALVTDEVAPAPEEAPPAATPRS